LTTAGLICIVRNGTARFFQYFNHIKCSIRVKLIDKTRYKNLDVHKPQGQFFNFTIDEQRTER